MSNSNEPVVVPSFLDEDLSQVDTTIPVIRGKITEEVEIVSAELSKSESGIDQLKITAKTVRDTISTKNETISAGFPLYANIGLTPLIGREGKKDRTADYIRKDVARFVQACGETGGINPLSRFVGKRCLVNISIRAASGKWPETNDIEFVKRG